MLLKCAGVYYFSKILETHKQCVLRSLLPPCAQRAREPGYEAMRRAETFDRLERNWREEKRLIDEKSINIRRTEAEWAARRVERTEADWTTRRAETIDGLKWNG